ncbi:hypothetical protein [Planctomycetes bacterium K23_9]
MTLQLAYGSPRTFFFNGVGVVGSLVSADEPQGTVIQTQATPGEETGESAPNIFSMVTPKAKEYNPAVLNALQRRQTKLKAIMAKLDDSRTGLGKEGEQTWQKVEKLAESAFETENPSLASKHAQQAIELLTALETDLTYANFRAEIQGKDSREILSALVTFSISHPEHPRLDELERSLKRLTHDKWLSKASRELKTAAPNDSGFSEGWLPIASAWQLVGNEPEARDAMRQAIAALPRMTNPSRAVESIIDLCQHESFNPALGKQLLEDAEASCTQISHMQIRSNHLANLAGLAAKLGHASHSERLLQLSISPANLKIEFGETERQILNQRARAASWTESPETVFAMCEKMEKLKYPKALINANAYGHAAIAAARRNNRPQFYRAMLRTENALAPVQIRDFPGYLYTLRLAEANILQRRWTSAVTVANNIPDPYLRASVLFRVMKGAPQKVRGNNLPELFERFAEQRWSAPACASYVEHRIRSGDSLLSLVQWSMSLPMASQRAAAFAGIARSVGTATGVSDSGDKEPVVVPVDIVDMASLMNKAEETAFQIQEPLKSASVWIQIARTWNLLGKNQRYQQAITNYDEQIFDAWSDIWRRRPAVKRSYNGSYVYASTGHRADEKLTIQRIITYHRHLATMQTDLGDSSGAMETCLNLANAAGFLNSKATFDEQNFLYIKALLNRLYGDTNVGPEAILLVKYRSYGYNRSLMAAWAKDLPGLQGAVVDLVKNSQRRGNTARERAQAARGFGELAILNAERGNLADYRDARRSAQSRIDQGHGGSEMKNVLATADALAGEFALAEANLVRGTVAWFGDANRPRKQLAISLAAKGRWRDAAEQASKVSNSQALYRAEAWTSVAEARLTDGSESKPQILDWANSVHPQVDRVAVFCGLALAAARR